LDLTKVANQAKPLQCSGKNVFRNKFGADVQTYGHRPRYTAINDAADRRVRSKMPGCCYVSDKGTEILFRINILPPLNKDRWTGRGGPMAWPPRSSDVTQMDFFLWGHIQALIYTSPVDFEENLITPVAEAAANIRQQPGIFERTQQSLVRRRLCIEVAVALNVCFQLLAPELFFFLILAHPVYKM